MAAMDIDSDSSLSEAPEEEVKKLAPIFMKAKKATKLAAPPPVVSPPRPKRAPSPPHEEVLADNPDIAVSFPPFKHFIVMFRSRFQEAFSNKLAHFGPQDIERGVVDVVPGKEIENLLCALLALVLNRKKPVERGHHGRALEEAVSTHKSQWPLKWEFKNPLHGGKDFSNMSPTERLNLLRTLVIWALSSSEVVSEMIKNKYKQQRHNDDENQPLSVQPWGQDGDKRRYFLIQGLDDTSFRVYREGSRHTKNAHWYSVAGNIEEVQALSEKLEKMDGTQAARRLGQKINNAIPMFEATEEKRRRREYRQERRAAFTRPEPGFGIYEGRTRGKRMRYTYEEGDEGDSDDASTRRSTRHQSARSTPFEAGPTYTASGRQIKQPRTGEYGESLLSGNVMNADELGTDFDNSSRAGREGSDETDPVRGGRATRNRGARPPMNDSNLKKRKHIDGYNSIDEMSEEDGVSGDGWDSEKNEEDEPMQDAAEMSDAQDASDEGEDEEGDVEDDDDAGSHSLIVTLKLKNKSLASNKETPPTSPPTPGRSSTNGVHQPSAETLPPTHAPSQPSLTTKIEASASPAPNDVAPSTSNGSTEIKVEQAHGTSTNGTSGHVQHPLQQVVSAEGLNSSV
ncbi:uncharacterized protein RCC_07575 [Ramularia collo-cygni]|uniref:WHIM1 domain-containing protein n=1 Tax=Ramularia collo-cygni TaxID=112498 RepID=A0A2D3V8F1_9PEZI|nr:uncharacterized protein RCC_07575 [Ramularia collo-cygni]CZT21710.1 uncharacterized protein RCC_07575 [Ramularia collo-cygni]